MHTTKQHLSSLGRSSPNEYFLRSQRKCKEEKVADKFTIYVTVNAVPKAMSIDRIRRETLLYTSLKAVVQVMHVVTWYRKLSDNVDTTAYKSMKHDPTATVEGDIVLCNHVNSNNCPEGSQKPSIWRQSRYDQDKGTDT